MEQVSKPKEESLSALAAMGISYEEAKEISEALLTTPTKDDRVCVCGHTMSKHNVSSNGIVSCKPSRYECPCKRAKPVLTCDNIRPFMRKTASHRTQHALVMGITKAIEIGATLKWIEEPLVCERCKEPAQVQPVCLTQKGFKADYPTGYDYLLCDKCFSEV
jgi:hypothetical protein